MNQSTTIDPPVNGDHPSVLGESRLQPHDTISKHKINKLILNYFIQEGFQNAALSFAKETALKLDNKPKVEFPNRSGALLIVSAANMEPVDFVLAVKRYAELKAQNHGDSMPFQTESASEMVKGYSSIEKRKRIKYLILKGDITQAIHIISTYFPTVLDSNNLLLFKLLRLNLIEMIREHKFQTESEKSSGADSERKFLEDILLFVRENLISKVTHSHELLKELEMTMSLLCFNFNPRKPIEELTDLPEELRVLFDLSLRNECYRVVNRVILLLESSDLDIQKYKGLAYTDFSPAMLQKLPHALPLPSHEDVEMADAALGESTKNMDNIVSFVHPLPQRPESATPNGEEAVVEQTLESHLERIALLWIATEQRLVERKLIPSKRYGLEKTDGVERL